MTTERPSIELDVSLALDGFELEVKYQSSASCLGVFGPSGSGKSSLLELVAGLRRKASGVLRVNGESFMDPSTGSFVPPEQRRTGYVPQNPLLFPHLSVRQNLEIGAGRNRSADFSVPRIAQLLEIGELLERSVAELSGGEAQRVNLGRALASAPSLLLLDEPFAALDLRLRRRLLCVLMDVRRELAVPMLFVSHDAVDVQALCDEMMVLDRGRIVASGAPRAVLTSQGMLSDAESQGYENVFSAELLAAHSESATLLAGGVELVGPPCPASPGSRVWISLPARDVILARDAPGRISARNRLPARVERIEAASGAALVTAVAGELELCAEVTPGALRELELGVGSDVELIIKARSLRLWGTWS